MRILIQRVSEASVTIEGKIYSHIQQGYCILLGIEVADMDADVEWLCSKIIGLRIFSDAEGKMNLSIQDMKGEILLISQFTLYAATKKGNRPSFIKAAKPETAMPLYQAMVQKLSENLAQPIQTGQFGADMKVALVNDGPVSIWMDSKNRE
jgi:D-aminoacyl-tRNA deacylase